MTLGISTSIQWHWATWQTWRKLPQQKTDQRVMRFWMKLCLLTGQLTAITMFIPTHMLLATDTEKKISKEQ